MAGQTVPVAEVPDPTFAQGMLGEGIAIIPDDGKVYAPCNATVDIRPQSYISQSAAPRFSFMKVSVAVIVLLW